MMYSCPPDSPLDLFVARPGKLDEPGLLDLVGRMSSTLGVVVDIRPRRSEHLTGAWAAVRLLRGDPRHIMQMHYAIVATYGPDFGMAPFDVTQCAEMIRRNNP